MSGGGRWTGSKLGGGSSIIFGRGGLGFRISGVGVGLDQVGLFWCWVIIQKGPFGYIAKQHKDHNCNLAKVKGCFVNFPKVISRTIVAKFSIPQTIFANFFISKFPGTEFANSQTPGTKM